MPMSLDFTRVVNPFAARFALQFSAVQRAFERIGDWLDARLDAARDLERATQAYPTVDFFGNAVTASIDRSQSGALATHAPPGFGAELAEGGRRFVAGFEAIPQGVEAGLVIPRALGAAADLFERIGASLNVSRGGTTLHDFLLRIADAMNTGGAAPRPGVFDALLKFGPRMAPAVATILRTLANFTRGLGTGAGPRQFGAFIAGMAALQQAWRAAFPQDSTSGGDPLSALRDATRYIAAALAGLPWLGAYLPIVWQMAQLAVRLGTLRLLESVEGEVWDLRKSVLEFFYVDLELYRRAAMVWLKAAQGVVVGQLRYYLSFAAIYVDELLIGLRRLSGQIMSALKTMTGVLNGLRVALEVLSNFDFLGLIAPGLPVSSPFTLAKLVEAVSGRNSTVLAGLGKTLDLVEPFASPSQKVLIAILRRLLRVSSFTSALPTAPTRPSITPLPDLIEKFLGPNASAWTSLLGGLRDAIQDAAKTILGTAVGGVRTASEQFVHLRDHASALDLTERFSQVMDASAARANELMSPYAVSTAPTGLEDVASGFERALASGGFDIIGAAIPGYIAALRDELPTSPHIPARHARLRLVHTPRLTIRAVGRTVDTRLRDEVAARAAMAIGQAYQRGSTRFATAGETP